jgi:hypothetical protein
MPVIRRTSPASGSRAGRSSRRRSRRSSPRGRSRRSPSRRRRVWQLVSGAGLAILGALYVVGGLGEPLDPVASDPNVVVYWLLRLTGLVGAVALFVAGVAAAIAALRGS